MDLGHSLDRLVGIFSPEAGVKRMRARKVADVVRLHYEGAAMSRRTSGWISPASSQNASSYGHLGRLRDRSRDLVRNNAWATTAADFFESEVVGTGIVPRPMHKDPALRKRALELWLEHCESTDIDSEGGLNVYGMQCLVARTIFESGEVLVRRRRRRPSDGCAIPLQLELLEPDHFDEARDNFQISGGGRIQSGIELDAIGARTAYWLFPQHPGDVLGSVAAARPVPASEILHVYKRVRAKQLRGIPALAAILLRLKDLDEYEDASLLKQKISACLTTFVTNLTDDATLPGPDGNPKTYELGPGAQWNLGAGEDVKFSDPPDSDNFSDFVATNLRAIASATGITYEALSGDWGKVNYSSARMGAQQTLRGIERFRWLTLAPQFLDPMWRWFIEAAQLAGKLPMTEEIGVRWTPPRRAILNPKDEVPGMRDQSRAGLTSISELIRQDGMDPEEVWTELESDRKRLAELGLAVEADPSTPMRGGPAQPEGAPPQP